MKQGVLEWIDDRADVLFEPLRGRPALDRTAAVVSNLADYGLVWAVLATGMGRRPGEARRRAAEALALSGFLSAGVNKGVKAVVQRERPAGGQADGSVLVRTPSSSSFPSGHTLAAFCTAVILPSTPTGTAACLTFATAVAASRVQLGHHHASDVLGGAAIGTLLGLAGRRVLARRRLRRAGP